MIESTQQLAQRCAFDLYSADRASIALGMKLIEAGPGFARVTMSVRADMVNGHGVCHGGLIFALADSAFAFACNSGGAATVASGASVEFLAPAAVGERLLAVAREQWQGGRTGLYDVVVTGGDCAVVAHMRGRSHRVSRAPAAAASSAASAAKA